MHQPTRVSRGLRRTTACAGAIGVGLVGALVGATPALADSQSTPTTISGSHTFGQISVVDTIDIIHSDLTVGTKIDWSQPASVSVDWSPNLVRQGKTLDASASYARTAPGSMSLTWFINGNIGLDGFFTIPYGATFSASGPCNLMAGGPNYSCHLASPTVNIVGSDFIPGPILDLGVVADVTVTPEGLETLRTASYNGTPFDTSALTLGESAVNDPLAVSCGAGVGDELGYSLGAVSSSPGIVVQTALNFSLDIVLFPAIPFPPIPAVKVGLVDVPFPVDSASASIPMSGAGATWGLGNVQANNVAPTVAVDAIPDPAGDEGTPITLHATATGPCAAGSSFVWEFSDGTKQFGATAHKTFKDSGPFTGTVTATDPTGLSGSKDFSLNVSNLAPNVKVTPGSPTVDWGRSLTFQAQAVDPGADDQSTLTYAWDFDDASPIVIGGPSESHDWDLPGVYDASVNVCDDDGACTLEEFTVTVSKRDTSVAYTGDNAGVHTATTTLSGSLQDEYGHAVNSGTVQFALGGVAAGSALTNGLGSASETTVVDLVAGAYAVDASFAGNTLYNPSGPAPEAYTVSEMATELSYTGNLSGGMNKPSPLSAKLVDALGRPLAGYLMTFAIGAQSVTAVTDSDGIATESIVVKQKPGVYELTASWAGDSDKYVADTDVTSFRLNKK